jgi:hypothetical protein
LDNYSWLSKKALSEKLLPGHSVATTTTTTVDNNTATQPTKTELKAADDGFEENKSSSGSGTSKRNGHLTLVVL